MTSDSSLLKDWNDSPTIRYTSERHIDLCIIQNQLDEIEDVLLQTLRYPTFADHHLPLDRLIIMKQRYESALDTLIAVKLSFGMRSVLEPRAEKPSAIIEQSMKQSYDFILDVLRLFSLDETDCYDMLFWRCKRPGSVVEFFLNVNDLFWWATADLEPITPEDLPAIRQALAEVKQIDPRDTGGGFELWAARKRKMRPQQPAYPKDERLRALFDACGPERSSEDEG